MCEIWLVLLNGPLTVSIQKILEVILFASALYHKTFCLACAQGTEEKHSTPSSKSVAALLRRHLGAARWGSSLKLPACWAEARPSRAFLDFSVLEFGFAISLLLRWKARLPSGNPVLRFLNTRSIFAVVAGATDGAGELPEWPRWICKAIGGFPYLAGQGQADKDLSGLVKEQHFPKATSRFGAMVQRFLLGRGGQELRAASDSSLLQMGLTCSSHQGRTL